MPAGSEAEHIRRKTTSSDPNRLRGICRHEDFHLAFDSGSPAGSYIATPYAEEDSPLALVIAGSFVGSVKAFCGEELSAGATYADVFVAGLDGQHRCRWARAFGSAGSDQVLDTIIGRDGGPLLLAALDDEARLDGVELPGPSCMLLKFDHKGVLDWNVRLPGCAVGAGDQPLVRPALPDALAVDEAGNFYVAQGLQDAATIGATVLPKPLAQALLVLKVSAAGAPTWAAVFGPESAPSRLYPHTISVAPDGHVYVLGHADGTFALPGGGTRPGPAWFVAALDPAGSTRWIQLYPDGSAPIADLAAHAGGVYALLASASSGPMQIAVQSLSLEGREVWRSELGDGVVSPLEIEVDRSGRAFVAGDAAEPATIGDESATGSTQIFLVSLEPDGRVAWSHVYGPQAPPPDAWLGLADLAVGPNDLLYVVTAGRELEPSVAAFQR